MSIKELNTSWLFITSKWEKDPSKVLLIEEKYTKEFNTKKDNGETNYFITLKNNGGRCPVCGKYCTSVKELKVKKIIHDNSQIIYYSARRLKCECGKTFYEENPFVSKEETIVSNNLLKRIFERNSKKEYWWHNFCRKSRKSYRRLL